MPGLIVLGSRLSPERNSPAAFACLLFGLIAYLPVSGIVALNANAAEHWIYLPTAFLFLAIGLEFAPWIQIERSRQLTRVGATAAICAWIAFLGGRTFARAFDWRDQRTFLERTIAHGGP